MPSALYAMGYSHLTALDINWETDDIALALIDTNLYTVDLANDELYGDIPTSAIIATSVGIGYLSNKDFTDDIATADDFTFPRVTGITVGAIVLYVYSSTASSRYLIAYIDRAYGLPFTSKGGAVILSWDQGSNRIFDLTTQRVGQPIIHEVLFGSVGIEIYFYDHTGTRSFVLTQYKYVEYTQRVNSPWNHILRIELAPDDDSLTFFRDTLVRDFIIEVYRTDPYDGTTTRTYEGFHRTLVDQVKLDGSVLLTLYGTGYLNLIKRRIVLPDSGQTHSDKTGAAETIMKEFVDEAIVSPGNAARIIPGFSIEADGFSGNTATYAARYTELFAVLSRLAETGAVFFGVTRDTSQGTFLFQVRALWGEDRRVGNAFGNPPVIFDLFAGNMIIPILSRASSDEVNYVYVGGQGDGISRTIVELENTLGSGASPYNRIEAFVDARNESGTDGVTTQGEGYLEQYRYKENLTFNVQQIAPSRWLEHWNLGDLITARYFGYQVDKLITSVNVIISAGETGENIIELISLEMEDYAG